MSTSHGRYRVEESVQAVDFRAGQNFGEAQYQFRIAVIRTCWPDDVTSESLLEGARQSAPLLPLDPAMSRPSWKPASIGAPQQLRHKPQEIPWELPRKRLQSLKPVAILGTGMSGQQRE
jgi:hypothetical protein